jgi:hypothetical protein
MSRKVVIVGLTAVVSLALAAVLMMAPSLLASMPRHAMP